MYMYILGHKEEVRIAIKHDIWNVKGTQLYIQHLRFIKFAVTEYIVLHTAPG